MKLRLPLPLLFVVLSAFHSLSAAESVTANTDTLAMLLRDGESVTSIDVFGLLMTSPRSDGGLIPLAEGDIVLNNGDLCNLSSDAYPGTDVTASIVVNAGVGGKASIQVDNSWRTLLGGITGIGNLDKIGAGTFVLGHVRDILFQGDMTVSGGSLELNDMTESASGITSGYAFKIGTGVLTIQDNATLDLNMQNNWDYMLENKIVLNGGSTIRAREGRFKFTNTLEVNAADKDVQITYDSNKQLSVTGKLSGNGTLKLWANGTGWNIWDREFNLNPVDEAGNDFNGTILAFSENGRVNVKLQKDGAAKDAVIDLQGSGKWNQEPSESSAGYQVYSILTVDTNMATIAGLKGNEHALVVGSGAGKTLNVAGSGEYAYAGRFGNNLNLKKSGAGTLILTGASTDFNGAITVSGGILQFGDGVSMGSFTQGSLAVEEGGTVVYKTADGLDAQLGLTLTGAGILRNEGAGIVSLEGDTSGFSGKFILNDQGTLQFKTAGNNTFSGALSGSGDIVKTGTGTTTLTNFTGDYGNGDVTVVEGILCLLGGRGSAPADVFGGAGTTGTITVKGGASLQLDLAGTFNINKTLLLENGGKLSSVDTDVTNINGRLNLPGKGTIEFTHNKRVNINGGLSGADDGSSILELIANDKSPWSGARLVSLTNSGENFNGQINVISQKNSGDFSMVLDLAHAEAASRATINLAGTEKSHSQLRLSTSSSIKGLNGDINSDVIASGGDRTLTVTGGGTFAGSFGAGVSLEKAGNETLVLTGTSGSFNGTVKVSGGYLQLGDGSVMANLGNSTVFSVTGGVLTLGANGKMGNRVEVQSGALTLDKEGTAVGDVSLSGTGNFNLAHAGASAGTVSLTGGVLNASAGGTLFALDISGSGVADVSASGLNVSSGQVMLKDSGRLKLTKGGLLAGDIEVNLSDAGTVLEIAKTEANSLSSRITGKGTLEINNSAGIRTTYAGSSADFSGSLKVTGGILALDKRMVNASASIAEGALLEFNGTDQQIRSVTGNTGKVSFTNREAVITSNSLLGNYGGSLLMSQGQQVTFSRTGEGGTALLGSGLAVEFQGGTGVLVLNNASSGIMTESVRDVVLTSSGTIRLTGENIKLYLNGNSWYGDGSGNRTLLTLDMGVNDVYVSRTLSERDLDRLYLIINDNGDLVEGSAILDERTGQLKVDVPYELTESVMDDPYQSFKITLNHSATGGDHILTGNTSIRALLIQASQSDGIVNTGLVLEPGVKLGIRSGRLTIKGTSPYSISGGSMGFINRASDVRDAEFLFVQDSSGPVSVSTTLDETVHVLRKEGVGELVMSGVLRNTGGINVESGRMVLTGTTEGDGSGLLKNAAELVLGDGAHGYAVNYAGLNATAGSVTTFSAGARLASGFAVENAGTVHWLMGGEFSFDSVFAGGGTSHIGGQTHLALKGGADQSFTVDSGSSVTLRMSEAADTGKVMLGAGTVYLENASSGVLDLSGVNLGTNWSRFTGTLEMTGGNPTIISMGRMGDGASVILSAGSEFRDVAEGTGTRRYHLTLGDGASLQVAAGAVYDGTLALGVTGTIKGSGAATVNSVLSGGTLAVQDIHLTLSGNNQHGGTNVGAGAHVTGTFSSDGAGYVFGRNVNVAESGILEVAAGSGIMTDSLGMVSGPGTASGKLILGDQSRFTINANMNFNGNLTGSGTLALRGDSRISTWTGETVSDFTGTVEVEGGILYLGANEGGDKLALLGTGNVVVQDGAGLVLGTDADLSRNQISLYGGSTLTGGDGFGGVLNIHGNEGRLPASAVGNLSVDSLHLKDAGAKLSVGGNLTVNNGGSFLLNDENTQSATGSLVTAQGDITLNGVFDVMLDTNNMFGDGSNTKTYMLFKAGGSLNIVPPSVNGGQSVYLDLDESMKEFFTLDQGRFSSSGIVSVTRKEMLCYLLDSSYVNEGGVYHGGFTSPNNASYLGANASNGEGVFFFDRKYTIAGGDNAYRLTDGDAWMNFHVKMTDNQTGAPTRLIVRENWMSPTGSGGVILSVRGDASETFTGGTQIFQAKVKVDGVTNVLNGGTSNGLALEEGDVYFFGTGRIEVTGSKAAVILNTGGDGSKTEYVFHNEIMLQQGATLEQTSSNNVLAGNLLVRDTAVIRNVSDQTLTLAGRSISGNSLKIQGAGVEGTLNEILVASINGEKVNAKLTTVDVSKNANLAIGRDASASINTLYLDKGSVLSVTSGGIFSVKEIKSGVNGSGAVSLNEGTFRLLGDFYMTRNGASFSAAGNAAIDTNGYYLGVQQDISSWGSFTLTGGGTMVLNEKVEGYQGTASITGKNTVMEIARDLSFDGAWSVRDGGTIRTGENVKLRGTLDVGAGGYTDFGRGTKLDGAVVRFQNGATYSGFLNADGADITFKSGSHFLVKTEDLRELTDHTERAMLIAENVTIEDGKGFFQFNGGDGVVNDAIVDSGNTKTLIIGNEGLTVGGLGGAPGQARDLTSDELSAMIGENHYRWLSFSLTSGKVGETGASLDLTVTRNVDFSEVARTANEQAIAPVLSYIGTEGGKSDSKLQGKELNDLGVALAKASDSNVGAMLGSVSLSTSSVMSGYAVQRENLRRHALSLRDRAVQEIPGELRHSYETLENSIWASGLGGTYSVDGDSNAVGHTTSLWGGQLGVSRSVSEHLVLGLAFTYTASDINLEQGMGDATNDAYYLDLYGKYHKDGWNVTGVVTGGFTDMKTTRNLAIEGFQSRARGSASGSQIMGLVEVGYEFDLTGDRSNIIEPFAVVTAGYSSIDGFTETGAGSAGLAVDSQSMASSSLGAGVRYVKEFTTSQDKMLRGRFEVRAMVLQDLTDNAVDVTGSFIGASGYKFTQQTGDTGKTGVLLGAGVVLPVTTNTSFFMDVDGEFRSSETGCRANFGVKYSF